MIFDIVSITLTGYNPTEVSPLSIKASAPSNTALATSEISALVGNLVSANGKDLAPALSTAGIGYVLVTNEVGNADLAVSLNSVTELDQVGTTEFGQLWKVKASESFVIQDNQTYWSITKSVQLGILIGFILLALPTSRGRKSGRLAHEVNEDSFQVEEAQ
jgi:hypothetical protein